MGITQRSYPDRKRVFRHGLFLFFFLLIISPAFFAQKEKKKSSQETATAPKTVVIDGKKYILHKIEKGQTLYAISRLYNVTVNDIVVANPEAIDGIKTGQELKIPTEKKSSKETTDKKSTSPEKSKPDTLHYDYYTAENGETVYSIAKKYGIKENNLIELNPELKNGLKSGQTIKLPATAKKTESPEKPVKTKPFLPAAEKKDSMGAIANKEQPLQQPVKPVEAIVEQEQPVIKDNYNIALFLPFKLSEALAIATPEEIEKGTSLPTKTEIALEFYQGVLLAFDSLRHQGFNAKLHVYDTEDGDSTRTQLLDKKPELTTMDLIIGPLYSNDFAEVAKFAKQHRIPIVSALSSQNKLLFGNPYASKVTPSLLTQLERTAEFVAGRYLAKNVILVNKRSAKDSAYVATFRQQYKINYEQLHPGNKDTLTEINYNQQGIDGIKRTLSLNDTNVIVVPSGNQVFVTDLITKLYTFNDKEKYKIVLVGMQSWSGFENIDNEYLSQMQLTLPATTFVDYENQQVRNLIRYYRELYKTEPGQHVFQGFDIAMYYMGILKKYGAHFQSKLPSCIHQGIISGFNFYQPAPDSGYENKAIFITRIADFKLIKLN